MSPERRRRAAKHLQDRFRASERRACRLTSQHRSSQRYRGAVLLIEPGLADRLYERVEDVVHGTPAIERVELEDLGRLLERPQSEDVAKEVSERARGVGLEAGRRQGTALCERLRDRRARLIARENAVELGQRPRSKPCLAESLRALRARLEPSQDRAAELRLDLEERAVPFCNRQRVAERGRAHAAGWNSTDTRGVLDLVDPHPLAFDSRDGGTEEAGRQLKPPAGLFGATRREEEALAGGVNGEGELQRLGVGPAGS